MQLDRHLASQAFGECFEVPRMVWGAVTLELGQFARATQSLLEELRQYDVVVIAGCLQTDFFPLACEVSLLQLYKYPTEPGACLFVKLILR